MKNVLSNIFALQYLKNGWEKDGIFIYLFWSRVVTQKYIQKKLNKSLKDDKITVTSLHTGPTHDWALFKAGELRYSPNEIKKNKTKRNNRKKRGYKLKKIKKPKDTEKK